MNITNEQLAAEIEIWFLNNKDNKRIWSDNSVGRILRKCLEDRNNFKQKPGGQSSKGGRAAMLWMKYNLGQISKQVLEEELEIIDCDINKSHKTKNKKHKTKTDSLAKIIAEGIKRGDIKKPINHEDCF